ncbi:hypothetical protein D3C75_1336930 [compost metagenome]
MQRRVVIRVAAAAVADLDGEFFAPGVIRRLEAIAAVGVVKPAAGHHRQLNIAAFG